MHATGGYNLLSTLKGRYVRHGGQGVANKRIALQVGLSLGLGRSGLLFVEDLQCLTIREVLRFASSFWLDVVLYLRFCFSARLNPDIGKSTRS